MYLGPILRECLVYFQLEAAHYVTIFILTLQMFEVDGEAMDLTSISGSRPSKYSINLAKRLFTDEELSGGMLSPQKTAKSRRALSPRRAEALKSKYHNLFLNYCTVIMSVS